MKITKFGHCCLLIELDGTRILTDPGNLSTTQDQQQDIDFVLITHEHPDHFHIESVKSIVANNPEAKIITNTAVAKLLAEAGIAHTVIGDKESQDLAGVNVDAYEAPHAVVYQTLPRVLNSGFLIHDTLLLPGDAFIEPGKSVKVLALPTAGPWVKLSESIDYALAIKPEKWFSVHDGVLSADGQAIFNRVAGGVLQSNGLELIDAKLGVSFDI